MMSNSSNFPQRPSPIIVQRHKNKKLMCHEEDLTRQLSNISNEGYHGVESASVPFAWESQPGTPKVRFRESSLLPPLTPPPSYQQNVTTKKPITKTKNKNPPKPSSILQTIFPKRGTRKACVLSPPLHDSPPLSYSSSSSSLSSFSPRRLSYSVPSSPMVHSRKGDEEEEDTYEVPRSSLCFGNASSRRCYSSMLKKVLLGDFM